MKYKLGDSVELVNGKKGIIIMQDTLKTTNTEFCVSFAMSNVPLHDEEYSKTVLERFHKDSRFNIINELYLFRNMEWIFTEDILRLLTVKDTKIARAFYKNNIKKIEDGKIYLK